MLKKILGILLIVVGGYLALSTLFPLMGSIFESALHVIKLALSLVILYVGYRLFRQD